MSRKINALIFLLTFIPFLYFNSMSRAAEEHHPLLRERLTGISVEMWGPW